MTANSLGKNSNIYDSIFDLTPFPMWIYDLKTLAFLMVNKEAIRQYGYTKEEFLSMTIKDIRPIEDVPKLEKAIDEVRLRNELYMESLFRHQKKDKSIIYVQIKSNLISVKGKPAEIVTAIDLTQRYTQEKHIEEQKKYLYTIKRINQILIKLKDLKSALKECLAIVGGSININRIHFYYHNPCGTIPQRLSWTNHTTGASIENDNPHHISFSEFPQVLQALKKGEPFQRVIADLTPCQLKNILISHNLTSILILPIMINNIFSGFIRLDEFGGARKWKEKELQLLENFTSTLSHIFKESHVYQKLVESEARFKSLVQNGTDLIAILDTNGKYKYVAPTSLKVLGIPSHEFIGKNAFDFINKKDKAIVTEYLELIYKNDKVTIEPYRFQDAKKNWQWIKTTLTNHLSDPAIKGIVANSKVITTEIEKGMSDKLLASLTKRISKPGSLADSLSFALEKIVQLSTINISEVWLISEDKNFLNLISKSCQTEKFNDFYPASITINNFEKGKGLPGYVWETEKNCIWKNLPNNPMFVRTQEAKLVNLNIALGVPIIYNKEFLGCLICYSMEEKLSDKLKLLTEVGLHIGAVVMQKKTEEHYRNFFEISPDPKCILGFDGYLKKINNSFENLLGYNYNELMNAPLNYFLHPADKEVYQKKISTAIQEKASLSLEVRFLTKNSKIKWLIWNTTVLPEAKVMIVATKDISQQKIAENKLKTAYGRLKTAQKIAKIGYWSRNLNAEVSEWNTQTYRIYGYKKGEFLPTLKNISQTFHPSDRHLIERDPREYLEPNTIKSFEHRILTAANEVKWVHQEIRLLTNEKHIPYRIEGTIQDITEKKEYELQLNLSNERFRLAMKASNEMMWEIDFQHKTVIRGKVYEKNIKYNNNEAFIKNNSWLKKIHSEDLEEVWSSFEKALNNQQKKHWTKEYRIFAENGTIFYMLDRCFILRSKDGTPQRAIGSALDITTAKQQFKRIKKQNESLREIAWLQSHVIRAPLSRIMGLVYFAKNQSEQEKSKEEIFDMIATSAEELDQVIHKIIDKTSNIYQQ
ncbi:PAS domain-containing protein [Mesonia sp. K4-1]|jgi:PAS domain S-box-containing protein|uniref:PAS domain-containing protein n=1 Tax=Mesonia sp. K4-1 TaxID=2602760 RepID=UPI001C9CA635|nr:PAS domain-containing protein [Mesonia sp. K4-1]